MTVELRAPELVGYLFAPALGPQAPRAYEYLLSVWERCALVLSIDREIAGIGVGAHLPTSVGEDVPPGIIAARERAGDGVFQAIARRDHDLVSVAVMLSPPAGQGSWSALDAEWDSLIGEPSTALFGLVRLCQAEFGYQPEARYQAEDAGASEPGRPVTPADAADAARAALPDWSWAAGWDGRGLTTATGFTVWEPDAAGDDRRERSLLVVVPTGRGKELSAWTWTDGGTGVSPLQRYLGHAAKLRHLARVWDGGRSVRSFRGRIDGRAAALADSLAQAGLVGADGPRISDDVDRHPGELERLSSALRVDRFHLVNVTTSIIEMRRATEIAASNMRAAVERTVPTPNHSEDVFADDAGLAAHLVQQFDDELVFLGTVDSRAQAAVDIADRLGLELEQASDLQLSLAERSELLDELADVFASESEAHRLLEAVGVPRRRHRNMAADVTPLSWWSEVFDEFDHGIVESAYRRLLLASLRKYPANQLMTALARRHGLAPTPPPP
jgi:Effector-associated domain 1